MTKHFKYLQEIRYKNDHCSYSIIKWCKSLLIIQIKLYICILLQDKLSIFTKVKMWKKTKTKSLK